MAITAKKSKLGVQDLLFDKSGTGLSTSVDKSDGTRRQVDHINASDIPTTTTTRLKKSADDTVTTTVDVDASLQELYDDVNASGVPDDVTIEVAAGVQRIKALGVDTAQLKNDAVTGAKILDTTITTAKLANDAVDNTKLKDDASVDVNRAVTTDHIRDAAVTTAKIADNAVTKAKLNAGQRRRSETIQIEDLGAGNDIAERVEWIAPNEGAVVAALGFALKGGTFAFNGTDSLTIEVRNKTAGNQIGIIIQTTDPGADTYVAIGSLTNTTLSSHDVISATITQAGVANAPAFLIHLEYEQTDS